MTEYVPAILQFLFGPLTVGGVPVQSAELITMLVLMVVSYAIQYAMRKPPAIPKPAAFEDINIPQSAEGTAQAMDFGTVWTKDWMVLGTANFRTEPIKKKGGKK